MKYVVFIILCGLTIACGGENKSNQEEVRLTFALDTVLINPGEEILFLNSGLYNAFLSEDKKFLYNFNQQEFALEKINLDKLAYEEKITFSKEGPNGVGDYLMQILEVGEDTLLFRSFAQDNFMDWNAKKIQQIDFRRIGEEGSRMKDSENLFHVVSPVGQSLLFYGLISDWQEKKVFLLKFDVKEGTCKRIELPFYERNRKYEIDYDDGQMRFGIGSARHVDCVGDKIILASGVFNEFYILNTDTDSFHQIDYECELTAKEKVGEFPSTVSDKREMERVFKRINEEINFLSLVWDEENEMYYRFSNKLIFDDSEELPENRLVPPSSGAVVYITLFDKELNKLAESLVPDLKKQPARHFTKDGKIWIFENIDDEMGFIRLAVNY